MDMSESEPDTSKVVVQTYVPAYQREEWDDHAAELDMNRSEFVRSMVQAGRRGFGGGSESNVQKNPPGDHDSAPDPQGRDLETAIEAELQEGPVSWDDLVESIVGDVESNVEQALEELQNGGAVRYSGPKDGYVLTDGDSA